MNMDRYARGARAAPSDAHIERDVLDVLPVRRSLSEAGWLKTALAGSAVVLLCGALLVPSLRAPVSEMDEGAVLAYGQLVNDGDLPGRDFETFYGPGQPWLAAAAFDVATPSVGVERALGFAARLIILAAIFAIALRWGILPAAAASAISALAMYPVGVGAFAFWSGLALSLLGLALLGRSPPARGSETGDRTRAVTALAAASGISSGLAVLLYVAMAPAVVLASVPLLMRAGRSARWTYVVGFLAALIPTVVWLAVVGPDGISQLVSDLAASRPGRRLPVPGPGTVEGELLLATVLATVGMLGAGALLWRSFTSRDRGALLLALGLFCLALFPQTFERADIGHVVSVGCVALAGVPLLVAEAASALSKAPYSGRWLLGSAAVLALLAAGALARASGPPIRDDVLNRGSAAYDVRINGRSVPIHSQRAASDLNAILPRLSEISAPGDSLFVGPADLRRTNYADTFVYFLMPELRPASFYTELNPGASNSNHSGLADDLRTADYLLLTSRWDDWSEPNTSSEYGSDAPSQVAASEFSPVARSGSYVLYAHNGSP